MIKTTKNRKENNWKIMLTHKNMQNKKLELSDIDKNNNNTTEIIEKINCDMMMNKTDQLYSDLDALPL